MNILKRLILLIFLVLAGCGGGSGTGAPASSAQLSGLLVAYSASSGMDTTAFRNSGGGYTATYVASATYAASLARNALTPSGFQGAVFDLTAPDGNVASFSLVILGSNGQLVASQSGPVANIGNNTTGKIEISFPALAPGNYSCQVSVIDSLGLISNALTANFTVN